MDMVITNLQQQRQITEQLRREAALKRIMVSKAVEDIMKYITEHEQEDCLLSSNMFSISLVTLDSYQSTPLPCFDVTVSDFRGSGIKQVPTIRIFGSTSIGIKTCLHIHGVFPYMYVPCTINKDVDSFMHRLAIAIDSAINVSLGSATSNNQHVYKIEKVAGIPLYGYHEKEHLFFKIFFYNPTMIKRAADVLQNGAVLNQSFQPHEAHIPFILQFMMDYNLYGMSSINLAHVKHRQRTISRENSQNESLSDQCDSQKYFPASVVRQSICELEVDAQAFNILNRLQIVKGLELNPGIAAIWNDEKIRRDKKDIQQAESQLLYPKISENRAYFETDNDTYQREKLARRLQIVSQPDECTVSTINTFSYPLEIEDEDNSLDALDVSNHFKSPVSSKDSQKKISLNEKLELEESKLLEQTSRDNNNTECSILDTEDMNLVDMLANLAEAHDDEKIVDDNSVLGSQYSILNDQVEDGNEDDEVEDLNITSLDLDSLSLPNSVTESYNQLSIPKNNNEKKEVENQSLSILEENVEDTSLLNFPQYDGVSDLEANSQIAKTKRKKEQYYKTPGTGFNRDKHDNINLLLKQLNFRNFSNLADFIRNLMKIMHNNAKDNSNIKEKIQHIFFQWYFSKFTVLNTNSFHLNTNNVRANINIFKRQVPEFICTPRKRIQTKKLFSKLTYLHLNRNISIIYKLDHNDLDVYDIDKVEFTESIIVDSGLKCDRTLFVGRDESERDSESIHELSAKLNIPALDGAATESASESESDHDITIDREDKRICVYNSCAKSCKERIVNTTPRKRKLHCDVESPSKYRKTNSNMSQNQIYNTPVKSKSSQYISGKYSPLNITVISPKVNRNKIKISNASQGESSGSKSNNVSVCITSKERNDESCTTLVRDKNSDCSSKIRCPNVDIKYTYIEKRSQSKDTNNIQDLNVINENTENDAECNDMKEVCHTATQIDSGRHSLLKTNKKVHKRLNFFNADEEEADVLNSFDSKHYSTNLLAESLSEAADYSDDPNNHTINCNNHENPMNEVQTNVMPSNDLIETEEELCNMTFTQYISRKVGSGSQSFVTSDEVCNNKEKKIVTIITKFNPPSRKRIADTLKVYDMLECKSCGPFFSDKMDFLKHKECLNKKTSISDVTTFKPSLNGITAIKLWRRVKVNEFHPSGSSIKSCDMKRVLAGYNSLVIQPLIRPPTLKNIKNWLKAKKYLKKQYERKNIKDISPVKHNEKDKKSSEFSSNCDEKLIKDAETYPGTSKDCMNMMDGSNNTLQNKTSEHIEHHENSNIEAENCSKKHLHSFSRSQDSSKSNDSLTFSLQKILENPLLYKNNETEYLGLSYGQIEYSIKESNANVTDENLQNARISSAHQYLTLLSVEVHVVTRGALLPDPAHDSIEALFYAIHNDVPTASNTEQIEHGAVIVNTSSVDIKLRNIHSSSVNCPISYVTKEEDLLHSLITLIRHCNPDILLGWEIESLSWGYIFQRAPHLGFNNFAWQISRIPKVTPIMTQISDKDSSSETNIPGRIMLDVWRIMRHEAALLNYTFENVMYHVMHERISCPAFKTLTNWWKHTSLTIKLKVLTHYIIRVMGNLRILVQLDIIGRTCEHARLFGIQFYEVFSRGSQFRVESMMLRLAKPLNYIPISPSIHQRARMRAPEALPLIMEPQSAFYVDPLIVLDFQSLYPSIIIAYNYCFSTCLGRIEHIGQYEPFEFGAATLRIQKKTAIKLGDKINFAPCSVAFVKSQVRQGILPRMLEEILNTRLMVKESMKLHGTGDRVLQRILHSQQLGLKLIANVTYGYTSANFSGRMPCIEVGDSVVSKGRETLERAIKIVESTAKWKAQVVYGDTDSLFILLPGRTRQEAFTIGAEIADVVTAANPPPVKLKFEKVLQPSILQTKKRYCGYMYETPEQTEPEYLAKGIETVRRDGCPAASKILEKSLKILFDTKDLSFVKMYVTRQFDKILRKKISIQDLTFAKEFRGLQGYKSSACVPALELTRRLMRKDPRAIPRTGERVRYVIIAGAPNQPLIQCVRTPMEVILDEGLSPNSLYYITKVIIPPLNRCLSLIDIDVNTWYRDMSHRQTPDKPVSLVTDNPKSTIRQFFSTIVCVTCGAQTKKDICINCMAQPGQTVVILHEKLRWLERTHTELTAICQSCTGYVDEPRCESLDCPVLYRLAQARRELVQIPYLNSIVNDADNNCKG